MRRTRLSTLLLAVPFMAPGSASAQDSVRITEWLYRGAFAEYFELTNTGAAAVDLSGWSMDDETAVPGSFDLSPLGVLAAGESAIVTEAQAADFELEWGLAGVKVLGGNTHNLARNDSINIYDATDQLHDRLTYGDEDFPGSLRALNESGNVCDEALGTDYVWSWEASAVGDAHGSQVSLSGDVGNPGSYTAVPCGIVSYCGPAVPNSAGLSARIGAGGSRVVADNSLSLTAYQMPAQKFGFFLTSETQGFVTQPPGSEGNLCLGGNIGRYAAQVVNSGPEGIFTIVIDLTDMPVNPPETVDPGETWHFSAWYRDDNPGPTSNFTDGVSVTFL